MIQTKDYNVYEGKPFGNIILESSYSELTGLGFEPGDSVDIRFSNGTELEDIPFLSGCVLPEGMICLNAYEGFEWIRIEKRFGRMWDSYVMTGKETGRIFLNEHRKYLLLQNVFNTDFSLSRECFPNDEVYANYRCLSGGKIRKWKFYRSSASFDPLHDRGEFVIRQKYLDKLLERDGIQFVVNMTCDKSQADEIFASRRYNGFYIQKLYEEGKVFSALFPADYSAPEFRRLLASALRLLMEHNGPYLLQCRAGLDRTGFVCCLLEALAGAEQKEITDDYMLSYECLCGVTKETNREKYDFLKMFQAERILKIMTQERSLSRNITAAELCSEVAATSERRYAESYCSGALSASAEKYLLQCGMLFEEISELKQILTESLIFEKS